MSISVGGVRLNFKQVLNYGSTVTRGEQADPKICCSQEDAKSWGSKLKAFHGNGCEKASCGKACTFAG